MTKNEAQTRQQIIDQRLKLSGWDVRNPAHCTEELDIWVGLPVGVAEPQTPYQGHLFADYVLLGKDGKPLAVVEAKKTSVDAEIGKEQARNYADQIQRTVEERHHNYFFLESLVRLARINPKEVGEVYVAILDGNALPLYEESNIKSIVEKIYKAKEKPLADWICDRYSRAGPEFLKALYEKYNR